ncbi:MAG: AI-2E family transporter [Novibacillus thermophilus]
MEVVRERWFRVAVGIILFLVIIWLLNEVKFIFTPVVIFVQTLFLPFLIAGILFYLCRPLIEMLERWRVPRTIAILLIFLVGLGLLVLVVSLIGPTVQDQVTRLIDNIPAMVRAVEQAVAYWQTNQEVIPDFVKDAVSDIGGRLQDIASRTGVMIAHFLGNVFNFVFALVVVPFILFYLLKDKEKFAQGVTRFFPRSKEREIRHVLQDMDHALSSYIKGQLIVSVCVGLLLLVGYILIGLDYALLLALIGMVTNVIPFLGPFLAVTPAVIVAWFQEPIMVLFVIVVMVAAQQIESNLVSPRVMGKVLSVHPLTIILLILVGGNLAGVLGMILMIPTYAVVKVVVKHSYQLLSIRRSED